jgi:hypothetical protein
MIPFAMVVLQVLGDGPPEMALSDWNDPIEALVLDRPDRPLSVRIGIRGAKGRHDHPYAGIAEDTVDGGTPFRLPITSARAPAPADRRPRA